MNLSKPKRHTKAVMVFALFFERLSMNFLDFWEGFFLLFLYSVTASGPII